MSFICAVSWLDANHLQPKQPYKPQQHSPKPLSMGTAELSWLPGRALGHGGHGSARTQAARHVPSEQRWEGSAVFKRRRGGKKKSLVQITWEVANLTALTFVSSPPTCTAGFASAGGEPGKSDKKELGNSCTCGLPRRLLPSGSDAPNKGCLAEVRQGPIPPSSAQPDPAPPARSPGKLVCIQTYQTQFGWLTQNTPRVPHHVKERRVGNMAQPRIREHPPSEFTPSTKQKWMVMKGKYIFLLTKSNADCYSNLFWGKEIQGTRGKPRDRGSQCYGGFLPPHALIR